MVDTTTTPEPATPESQAVETTTESTTESTAPVQGSNEVQPEAGEQQPETSAANMNKVEFHSEYEDHVHKIVDRIEFGILSPKMIKKLSFAKVVTPELYDKEGYPVDGGLMDTRLGVIDPGLKCRTDGRKLKDCPGYFGHIELARPVIHFKFVTVILNLLKSSCRECGRVMVPANRMAKVKQDLEVVEKEEGPEARRKKVKEVIDAFKNKNTCPHCKAPQQKIAIEKPTTFLENEKRISPIEVRTRLEKIPDEDLELFGFNPEFIRPEWMVLTIFPIPPVTMRPSITLESGERSEDDLTHKLGDIVRINQRLFENINAGAPEIIIEDLWDLLQYHITTFFDNAVAQLPPARHRSGQPLKTITERIKSKEGRIRHNLAGKRTNFSARTVVSPDPRLEINEVGVPEVIAMNLTVPVRITEWNLAYMKSFVERGAKSYPGANYVIRPDGKKKKITDETKEQCLEELQPGYLVERHLMDGDVAVFNRQPSLHRMSMMCHKVVVLPGKTLRLNPAVCIPYNADFDGDEMNLHIPQTEEARAEAEVLMEVTTQLISPRYGLNIIGCSQDAIAGNYVLTRDDMELDHDEAVDILFTIGIDDLSKLPKKAKVTGREVFSVLLPADFSYKSEKKKNGDQVIIEKGMLTAGTLDKGNLGEGAGLLLRTLHKKYGAHVTVKILANIFRLGIEVLARKGFSVSISDTDLPPHAKEKIDAVFKESKDVVHKLIEEYQAGTLEAFPGRSEFETLELKVLEELNKARNTIGNLVQEHADKSTHTIVMADSGSKGNFLNLAQMAACVGQQAMRGKRISKGFFNRTLPHFKEGELSPESRGFIEHGFKGGLAPHEFFFGAMTGRDSLMDTALRTPKSGYLYRRLANAMQDLKVEYDETVRDAAGKIIQFKYGEDGIDVSKSENGTINIKRVLQEV